MSSPSRSEIAQAILDMSAKKSSKNLANAVAAYLVKERRTNELDAVLREVAQLRSKRGVAEVTITSANPLSAANVNAIKKALASPGAVVNTNIDKTVIGGVRVESGEQLLDLTVRNRLNKLKQGVNT